MTLLDVIYPKKCLSCLQTGEYICPVCLKKVREVGQICPVCTKPSFDGITHKKCKKQFSLDGLTSLWEYEGVIRKVIISMKYKFTKDVAEELAGKFLKGMEGKLLPKNAFLIPVPMHPKRLTWRGFNQTTKLGRLICLKTRWKFVGDVLIKTKATKPQTDLKGKERKLNLSNSFSLNKKYKDVVFPYPVILFDDIWTTGSTLKECAKVLKENGVKIVWGLTLARTS